LILTIFKVYKDIIFCIMKDLIKLSTGDIFLFEFNSTPGIIGFVECCIRCFTDSRYSHSGFVWVDPIIPIKDIHNVCKTKNSKSSPEIRYETIPDNQSYVRLKGEYIWDSAMHEIPDITGKKHRGVQLTYLKDYIDKWGYTTNGSKMKIYKRSPVDEETYNNFNIEDKEDDLGNRISRMTWLYNKYKHLPYDFNCCDWFRLCLRCRCVKRDDAALVCSAFVSIILTTCGILPSDTNWKVISPGELSSNMSWCVHWLRWKLKYKVDKLWDYREYRQTNPLESHSLTFFDCNGHPKK